MELKMIRHALPPLPYDYGALKPWIDDLTMQIHYDHHHRQCVDHLNVAQERLVAAWQSGDFSLIRHFQRLVALNESGHFLHSVFWETMGPNQGGQPRAELLDQINQDFGSFASFKSRFSAAASSLQDGGWVVLAWHPGTEQIVIRAAEHHWLPVNWGGAVLLVLDVWEHAYYLKYQNRRAEYVHNWWNTVNWPRVAQRFAAASQPDSSPVSSGTSAWASPRRRRRNVALTCHDDAACDGFVGGDSARKL
jgi:Fe-Mn family superoxide dismutase